MNRPTLNPAPLQLARHFRVFGLIFLSLTWLPLMAGAAPDAKRYLPAETVVKEALLASPGIDSARAQKQALNLRDMATLFQDTLAHYFVRELASVSHRLLLRSPAIKSSPSLPDS
jgi:hypothetical protein